MGSLAPEGSFIRHTACLKDVFEAVLHVRPFDSEKEGRTPFLLRPENPSFISIVDEFGFLLFIEKLKINNEKRHCSKNGPSSSKQALSPQKKLQGFRSKKKPFALTKQLLSVLISFTVYAFFEYSSVFIHFIKRNQPYIILFRLFDQAIRKSAF